MHVEVGVEGKIVGMFAWVDIEDAAGAVVEFSVGAAGISKAPAVGGMKKVGVDCVAQAVQVKKRARITLRCFCEENNRYLISNLEPMRIPRPVFKIKLRILFTPCPYPSLNRSVHIPIESLQANDPPLSGSLSGENTFQSMSIILVNLQPRRGQSRPHLRCPYREARQPHRSRLSGG